MATMRRDLRKKFEEILIPALSDNPQTQEAEDYAKELAEKMVDAAIELQKPKMNVSQSDPAWALFHGEEVSQETIDNKNLAEAAFNAFETDMGTPKNWSWYPARTSEDPAWKPLREFVVEQYKKDPKCFQTYQTWRTQPFARGAMSNLAIKKNPENFPSSWTDFLASNAMYGQAKPIQKIMTDDNDLPISY